MFKKKPNIKPLAPLRSSDRRKIADRIIAEFGIEIPRIEQNNDNAKVEASSALSLGSLRNSLLPDNALSARFMTTTGPDLKQVSGIVFAGAYPGDDQRILWFKIEERLIPTVYTLWQHPRLVPLLHTPDFVLQKLRSGAPLMTPGLANGPPFPSKATKDAIVAISSLEKPTVPMVVGICEIDVAFLQQVQGAKGLAVRSEHWDGDELWAWSQGVKSVAIAPDEIKGWGMDQGDAYVSEGVERISLGDPDEDVDEGGVLLQNTSQQHNYYLPRNEHIQGEDTQPFEKAEEGEREFSTKEIDDVFWKAFLYAAQHHRNTHKADPHHGLNFPVHQSLVISNLILPYLPIHTPAQAASLQIKKTSWKNTKKFIKALDKQKLLKSKDRDGGECVVLNIDFEDPAITSFVPYGLPKKEASGTDMSGGGGGKAVVADSSSSDPSIGQCLNKISLLRPKEKMSPMFEVANATVKAFYLPAELRSIITSYIESENLVCGTNKRMVNLNPVLANSVFDGNSSLDREVIAKGSVPRDALIDRILQSCSPFWAILRNDEIRENVKAKSGNDPKVQIVLETRSGSKTDTKVSGIELFFIPPQPLAEELQRACASSTSVNQLSGSSAKNPVQEIMVQGPQKDAVVKALQKRGVHKQWIELQDKTKGKKK